MGGAVARALAKAGAHVILAGRTMSSLESGVKVIRDAGGHADLAIVDALDEKAVNEWVKHISSELGSIDISFCAIDHQVVQNMPLTEMTTEDFVRPIDHAMRAQFVTAIAAAKIMQTQRSGVILTLTATPGGIGYPFTGGFAPACAAVESFVRNLASETGPTGVRVVNIRSAGTPDSRVFRNAAEQHPRSWHPYRMPWRKTPC